MQVEFIKIYNFTDILLFNLIKNRESDSYLFVRVTKISPLIISLKPVAAFE